MVQSETSSSQMQVFNYVNGRLNPIQDSGIYRCVYLLRLSAGLNKCMILKISFLCTLYPHKLAITSPTRGGRSVGIVRSRTQTMEFSFLLFLMVFTCHIFWTLSWNIFVVLYCIL
jgi:hypothetical protein